MINGVDFAGNSLVYATRSIVRLERQVGSENVSIDGKLGSRPAIQLTDIPEGLLVLGYQSVASRLNYSKWEKFQAFADEKGLENALDVHLSRGLSPEKFGEGYTRYSKSLIGVGDAKGTDRPFGFEAELVANTNPYTNQNNQFDVTLLYQGQPLPDAQIDVFSRSGDGVVDRQTIRTDMNGQARFMTKAGYDYMLDAVIFREPSDVLLQRMQVEWETLWANLTFAVPD